MAAEALAQAGAVLRGYSGPLLRIMEVCGTHTHEIFRQGIRSLLPPAVRLISGPGCPVCVTPVSYIDEALWLALERRALVCTFGDLVRVPGSRQSLAAARGQGADIRVVYSPLDALHLAEKTPERELVFLSVGFETTAPSECLAVRQAVELGIRNFSLLVANKTMPRAYRALRGSADVFLYPGHVCAITGTKECEAMAARGASGVVAGFTAEELLGALAVIVTLAQKGRPFFRNCYPRVVRPEGNSAARALMNDVMEACDTEWRGLGVIPASGLRLREKYRSLDARVRFAIPPQEGRSNPACRCGDVLRGLCLPSDCKVFGRGCTPEHPIGACMVSHEGACSAWFQYGDGNGE